MPIINIQCPQADNVSSQTLLNIFGPLLNIEVSIPSAISDVLQKTKQIIPNPITGIALLDTGATKTCVDEDILKSLGLNPVGDISIATPQGTAVRLEYPVKLDFIGTPMGPIEFNSVIGADLKTQNIIALIGRDILCQCIFIMNGPAGSFSLSF